MAKPSTKTPEQRAKEKADKFKELAEKRMPKVLGAMKGIRNIQNKGAYAWTPKQAEFIVGALQSAVDEIKAGFASGEAAKGETFSLPTE